MIIVTRLAWFGIILLTAVGLYSWRELKKLEDK